MTPTQGAPDPTVFQATMESAGDSVIVSVAGEVDMLSAPRLEEAAQRALADTPPVLVLDLSSVTFLSSAGLSVLVRTEKLAGDNTDVHIVAAGPATLRPIQLMGLDKDLAIYPTRDEAVPS